MDLEQGEQWGWSVYWIPRIEGFVRLHITIQSLSLSPHTHTHTCTHTCTRWPNSSLKSRAYSYINPKVKRGQKGFAQLYNIKSFAI